MGSLATTFSPVPRGRHNPQPASETALTVTNPRLAPIHRAVRLAASTRAVPLPIPPSEIHFNWLARSLALCHRSSGAFSRHFLIVRSRADGVSGRSDGIGTVSFSRIDEATLSWLLPTKARCPVHIS